MVNYRELDVWKVSVEWVAAIYRATSAFPQHELYGIRQQVCRSAVSIPANIAEGHGRDSTKEFLHHISIAMGSLFESETHVIIAERLGYLSKGSSDSLLGQSDQIGRMLRGLQKALKDRLNNS